MAPARLLAPLRLAVLATAASLVPALPASGAAPVGVPLTTSATSSIPGSSTVPSWNEPAPNEAGQDFVEGMLCPSMPEEPALASIHADWEGQRIYFCCKMCRREFLEDPQPILANLAAVGQAPTTPSTSAGGIDPSAGSTGDDSGSATAQDGDPAATSEPTPTTTQEPAASAEAGEAPVVQTSPEDGGASSSGPSQAGEAGETGGPGWLDWFGRLHPLAVHFPITLLILAGVAELLVRSNEGPWRGRARFLLALGAPAAAISAWLGWLAGADANYPGLQDVLFRHRWLGVATAVLSLSALALAPRTRARGTRRERAYRWLVFASLLAVVLAGHHGGILVFGPDHLRFP